MKTIIALCGFVVLFTQAIRAEELEWAKRARELGPSPETKAAYDKAVAAQKAKRELERQEHIKRQESFKKFEEEQDTIQAENEAEQEKLQKVCGSDYGEIRAGMSLARVQKCYGEFFLRGQVNGKYGVVEHYTRGGTYLYVKKGKVVAWGE